MKYRERTRTMLMNWIAGTPRAKPIAFSLKLEGTGDHEITATVYEGSEVAQDPAGNDLIESVTVEVTAKDDGGSNTMLYVVIALIALVVVIALVFFMRRK